MSEPLNRIDDAAGLESRHADDQRPYQLAYDILRQHIVGKQLPPGLVLLESRIAELMDISRAPVRRALELLHRDGFVRRFEGRGYLVGSDGGRSFVRQALDVSFPGKTLGARAVVADVMLTGLERDAWHRFNGRSTAGQLSLCPLAGTELFQLQTPIPLEGDVDLSAQGLTAMVAERTRRDDIRISSVSWASAYNINARLADRYRVGRVFLAGDAAHIHPPTGGQGLNTSVQDAYNLGWKLAAVLAGAPDALLDTYEEERRPIAAEMLGLATKLLDAAKRGDLRRGREVQQLDLGYPESSLTLEKPARSAGIRAGDRAPDAPVGGAAGQATHF